MSLRRITKPDLPISVSDAKWHLRVDHDDDDALIETYIRAALAAAEQRCGCAFQAQEWELVLDAFPGAEIELLFGPVASVVSVVYDDETGDEQVVDPSRYIVDTASPEGWVVPIDGYSWPSAMATINAVRVRYIAGTTPPDDVMAAILLLVGHYYANREDAAEMPLGAKAILDLHRQMYV